MTALPLFEVTRGDIVESVHYGSIAVVDSNGKLISSYGDPKMVAFLRSSAKPFQALPFVEHGGVEHFGFTPRELSILCASHEGSDLHVQTVEGIQKKIGLDESNLQCGTHMPGDVDAFKSVILNDKQPTPNRNNCSGKHTAMLAYAKMRGLALENYLDINIRSSRISSLHSPRCACFRLTRSSLALTVVPRPILPSRFTTRRWHLRVFVTRVNFQRARASACRKITSAMTTLS